MQFDCGFNECHAQGARRRCSSAEPSWNELGNTHDLMSLSLIFDLDKRAHDKKHVAIDQSMGQSIAWSKQKQRHQFNRKQIL